MTVASISLTDSFRQYFSVNLAVTPEQKQAVYRIRYSVYCEEFSYESTDNFPHKQEFDSFDESSLHCLITHKGTGRPAGCVRVVIAGSGGKALLPMEMFCAKSFDREVMNRLIVRRDTLCEVSRLAVDGAFRRRAGEARTRFGDVDAIDCSHVERRTFSLISVAAFLAATALTDLTGRTSVFAMMEPFLPKLLKRSGIIFQKVGEEIDYHGLRAPYFATTGAAVSGMLPDLRKFYDAIYDEIQKDYRQYLDSLSDSLPQASAY